MSNPMSALAGIPEQIARYQLLSELGRGSMGHVYLALDPNIDRKVALKIFLPLLKVGAAEQWELRQRFVFEARAAGQLNHPGIVTIFDADTDPETGLSYLAMEWVNGPSLDDLIRESGPLAVERSTRIVEEVALALHAAHRQGLVHRDIKPANILLENSGRAKVTDFGIAKLASMSITTTGWIPGSPFYMSPEQIRNENIDRRSDLYALGAVLYQCLTNTLPFEAESLAALTHAILEIDPRPVRSINPQVSGDLAAFIDRALAKSPDERFDSGREFAQALRLARAGRFRASMGVSRRSAPVPDAAARVDADLAGRGGTATIGLAAPEIPGLDAPDLEETMPSDGEVAEEAELPLATPPPAEEGAAPAVAVPPVAGVATASGRRARRGARQSAGLRLTLAAVAILALVAIWSLRPVESQPTGASTPLARLFTATPRFATDAPSPGRQLQAPAEPAPEVSSEAEAEVARAGGAGPALPSTSGASGVAAPARVRPTPRPRPSARSAGSSTGRTSAPAPGRAARPRSPAGAAATSTATPAGATPAGAAADPTAEGEAAVGPADAGAAPAGSSPAGPSPSRVVAPRATSRLEVVYRNRLKSGVLSISVDGRELYANKVARTDGFFGSTMGKNVWTSLDLTPGKHVIDVRVTGSGGKVDLVRQTTAVFGKGRTHRLRVTVTPFRKLKLSWKESPVD